MWSSPGRPKQEGEVTARDAGALGKRTGSVSAGAGAWLRFDDPISFRLSLLSPPLASNGRQLRHHGQNQICNPTCFDNPRLSATTSYPFLEQVQPHVSQPPTRIIGLLCICVFYYCHLRLISIAAAPRWLSLPRLRRVPIYDNIASYRPAPRTATRSTTTSLNKSWKGTTLYQ